jgi:hypothetical protein
MPLNDQLVKLDVFTNQLYLNVLDHLPKIVSQVNALDLSEVNTALSTAAIKFADSNDPADRDAYLTIKRQIDGIQARGRAAFQIAVDMLTDPLLAPATLEKIYVAFPNLRPKPPELQRRADPREAAGRGVELDDLMSAGHLRPDGRDQRFDLDRGVKFETYCAPRIRGAILDELRSMDWVPRLVRSAAPQARRAPPSSSRSSWAAKRRPTTRSPSA